MKKFEILEYVNDLKIRVFGKTKEEFFLNAMLGMYEGGRYETEGGGAEREITISSPDLPSLLVDFLSELLYLAETNHEVYSRIRFTKFTNTRLEGILKGKRLKRMGVLIKGVTYHDLDIHQKKDGVWEATKLFDI